MKAALVKVTSELLAQLLHFPAGTTISGLVPGEEHYVSFIVQHEDLAESPNVGVAEPTFRKEPDGSIAFVNWGQR